MSKSDGHWFSHDNNSAQDPKIVCLVAEYGYEGYGRFWRLLEICHSQAGYKYSLTDKIAYASLAMMLGMTTDRLKDFLHYCIHELNLLQTDGEYLWNDSMLKRMEYWDNRKAILSERGKKGAAIKKEKQAIAEENASLAEAGLIENEANETKQNDTKQNETTPNNNSTVDGAVDSPSAINTVYKITKNASPAATRTEAMMQRALGDNEFCHITMQSFRISNEQLRQWLGAFNRKLAYEADTIKNDKEYRRHFVNWLKYRDVQHEDPAAYQPVSTELPPGKTKRVVPLEPGMKTGQQIIAEQRAYMREMEEKWKDAG